MNNGDKAASPAVNGYLNSHSDYVDNEDKGLTKREHFAGLAMQGLCANSHLTDMLTRPEAGNCHIQSAIAVTALEHADALLKELDK